VSEEPDPPRLDIVDFRRGALPRAIVVEPTIEPYVNGLALRELAREVELAPATASGERKLAGSYAGVPRYNDILWPSRHFLGEPEPSWFEDGDTVLLGCECGEWGCWPLTAKVEVTDALVTWSGFRNGHRDWDLSGLGPYVFDRDQYERALGK